MQIYGFGINPLDQFGASANNFTIYDAELGRSLDVREWSKKHNTSFKAFYEEQAKILGAHRDAIFKRDLTDGGLSSLPIDDVLRTFDSVNKDAVNQVMSASENWKSFIDIVRGNADPASKTIYGFDLETFGDIQHGNGIFGITEIAIGKRSYDTLGPKGRIGTMTDGASIAVGIKSMDEYNYLNGLIRDFRQGKWDTMSQSDQVSLRRLSRYAGQYEDIFTTTNKIGFLPGQFTIVKQLSDELLSPEAMDSGLRNLQRVGNEQSPAEIISKVSQWLAQQADDKNVMFYGANSAYDFDSFKNMLSSIGADESMISKIHGMKDGVLDTVYLMRAVSTAQGKSVKGLMQEISGEYVGATVDEQVRAFALALEQTHFGFADVGNEGGLADYYARNIFTSFFDTDEPFKGLFSDHDLQKTVFRIKNGQLKQADGMEFGYTPGFDGNKYGDVVHNMSIVGDSWIIDSKYSGRIKDANTGNEMFTAVFKNVADELLLDEENSSRFVLTAKTAEELNDRIAELAGNSDLYTLPDGISEVRELGMDSPMGRSIIAAQEQRAADLGRREFAKLFSPGDSRVNNGEVTTGYNRLHAIMQFEEQLRQDIDTKAVSGSYFDPVFNLETGRVASPTDGQAIQEFIQYHNEYIKNGGAPIIFSKTQAQTYLGMRSRITDEYDLLKTIDDTIQAAYQGQAGVGVDVEKTAVASRIYRAASDILSGTGSEHRWRPEIASIFDDHSVDLTFRVGDDMQYFRVNAISEATAIKDVRRFLRNNKLSLDEYNAVVSDLKTRGILSQDYKPATDSLQMDWFSGQDLGAAIYKEVQTQALPFENRILHDITDEARASQLRAVIDPETGSPIPFGEVYRNSPGIREAIEKKTAEIMGSRNKFQYFTLDPDHVDPAITAAITGEDGLLKSTGMSLGGGAADKPIADLFHGMFYQKDKSYAIAGRAADGIQGFIISADNHGVSPEDGIDSYMLLTNKRHSSALLGLLDNEEALTENMKSYKNMMDSEIARHATVIPIPRIHKWMVGQGSGIEGIEPTINAVAQGENFFKIVSPELRTFIGDDGRMRVSFEDPATQMASLYRKNGGRILDYVFDDEFKKGSNLYRRSFNDRIKFASSFTTRYGADKRLHINMNDASKGFEVRLQDGLSAIFNQLALTPDTKDGSFSMENANPIQRIVNAFGEAREMKPENYGNNYYDYFSRILNDKDFQEVLHSRMVYGQIAHDTFLGGHLPKTEQFEKNIYDIMSDVITGKEYAPLVDSLFFTQGSAYNIRQVFSQLPKSSALDAVGSESAVKHGAYYLAQIGSFNPMSNLQSMMRPAYIQQGNSYAYDLAEMREASGRLFKEAFSDGSKPIYFGMNQMSAREFNIRQSLKANNNIIVDEGKFLGAVKTMGDFDLQTRFIDLASDKQVAAQVEQFNRIFAENNIGLNFTEDQYKQIMSEIRRDLGHMYEDAGIISPALQESPLFKARDGISMQITNPNGLDVEYTRDRLQKLARTGELRPDTVIGRTNRGRDIYFGKAPVKFSEDQIEDIIKGKKVTFDPLDYGDIYNNKVYVNGMEKMTTHTINFRTLLDRVGIKTASLISRFGVDEKAIETASLDLATYAFGQLTDGAVLAGNFQYMKHGGIAGLRNAWNLVQVRYAEQAANNPALGHAFAESLNKVAADLEEYDVKFAWNEEYQRFVVNDSAFKRPTAFYERLIEREMKDGILSVQDGLHKDSNIDSLMRSINASIMVDYDRYTRLNIGISDIQRQIMNEHMGTKFTVDQRLEQALRFQGLQAGTSTFDDSSNQLVDAFKSMSMKYSGYAPIVSSKGTPFNYSALSLIQKHVGLSKGATRAKYNRDAAEIGRSIKGMTEAISDFRQNTELSEIARRNVVEVDIDELLNEVRRGTGDVTREDLMESIFFVDGEPSDFLKRLAQRKQDVDLENGSFTLWVNTGGRKISVDNVTPFTSPSDPGVRTQLNGFSIPIFSGNPIGSDDTIVFQQSQHDTVSALRKMSNVIFQPKEVISEDTRAEMLGSILRDYYGKLDEQTDYLKKNSEVYKYAQTWVIPHSGQFLSQDQLAPIVGLSSTEMVEVDLNGQKQSFNFRKLYKEKRSLEEQIKTASAETEFIGEKLIDQYNTTMQQYNAVLQKLRQNIVEDSKNRTSDISILEQVLKEAGLSDIDDELAKEYGSVLMTLRRGSLDIGQREFVNGNFVNGLAVAISEEGFEQQLGVSMGDVAQSLVDEYERLGASEYLSKTTAQARSASDLTHDLKYAKKTSFDKLDEFFGKIEDKRFLEDGLSATVQDVRQKRMLSKYVQLRARLASDERTALDYNLTENDIIDQTGYISIAEAADRKLRQLFAEELVDESNAVSIKQLNQKIASGEVISSGMPEKVRNFYEAYQEIFKEAGIAQDYLQEVGMQGLITRYPVFNIQPWVRVMLDQSLQGKEIRASNPILNKILHLDNDGDQVMLGVLARGSTLMSRRHGKNEPDMIELYEDVYHEGLESFVQSVLSDAFSDDSPYKVNDTSNYAKQEAAMLEIIDAPAYKQALETYLEGFAKANNKGADWAKTTLKDIKKPENAGILEAALNSQTIKDFYKEKIGSTLTNDNALISSVVARVRKDYIGYVSTPNYRAREALNYTYRMVQSRLKDNPTEEVKKVLESQEALLRKAMLGVTSFETASGGIFSIIEQKVIDPKHARDGLSPIGITKYTQALTKLLSSNGDKKAAFSALDTIMSVAGPKAFDVADREQVRNIAQLIVDTKDLKSYETLIERLREASKVHAPTLNDVKDLFADGVSHTVDTSMVEVLEAAKPFKALHQITQDIPEFADVWTNLVRKSTFDTVSKFFKGLDEKTIEKFDEITHGLGIDGILHTLYLGDAARSSTLPPFKKGSMYFSVDTGYGDLKGQTKAFVYQGNGLFYGVGADGEIDKADILKTKKAAGFDNIGFDRPISFEAYRTDPAIKQQVTQEVNSYRVHKYLNELTIGNNDTIRRTLPKPLSKSVAKTLNREASIDLVDIGDRVIGGRQNWDITYATIDRSLKAYQAGLGMEIPLANAPSSSGDLLRAVNEEISKRPYRDLSAISMDGQSYYADLVESTVRQYFGNQNAFNAALERSQILPEGFDYHNFNNQLAKLSSEVYNVGNEAEAINASLDVVEREYKRLIAAGASGADVERLNELVKDRQSFIGNFVSELSEQNLRRASDAQDTVIKMLSPDGTSIDRFKGAANLTFRWGDGVATKDSIIGFGSFMGQKIGNLSASDISIIRGEADTLIENATRSGTPLSDQLQYMINVTRQKLDGYTPTATVSALKKNTSAQLREALAVHDSAISGVNASVKNKESLHRLSEEAAQRMKKQTISGGILDKAKSLNISGKHVAVAVGAMATLGLTNKLLHRRSKTPLEAQPTGAGVAPVINGRRQDDGPPPSANTGRRTVYHDAQSGLDFKVSAQTKRRLDANGYGGVVNRAGGGSASVHIYNDTRGVSDNWLSNKFSELAE